MTRSSLHPLSRLAEATEERARLRAEFEKADEEWRLLISGALFTESAEDVAKTAGITRARVYQIRDGKR